MRRWDAEPQKVPTVAVMDDYHQLRLTFCIHQALGCMSQVDRMDAIAAVHDFRVRVVVATDLASRGLDLASVNLVGLCRACQSSWPLLMSPVTGEYSSCYARCRKGERNPCCFSKLRRLSAARWPSLDLPYDAATYMHRVGRTGRFGTHGTAIAFVTPAELQQLRGFLQDVAGGQVRFEEGLPSNGAMVCSGWWHGPVAQFALCLTSWSCVHCRSSHCQLSSPTNSACQPGSAAHSSFS